MFTFGSWTFTTDDSGILQGRLMETSVDQAPLAPQQDALEDLAKNLVNFLFPVLLGHGNTSSNLSPTWT